MSVYVCMYVLVVYACMDVCTCVCVRVCVGVRIYIYIYIYIYTYIKKMYVSMCVCVDAHTCIHNFLYKDKQDKIKKDGKREGALRWISQQEKCTSLLYSK